MKEYSGLPSPKVNLLARLVETIIELSSPEKIILFGSQAQGTATEISDYDFLIIEKEPFGTTGSRRKEAGKLGWALSKFGVATDILIYSPEEIEQRRQWKNGVVTEALSEGKVLYERVQ
ncbi:MAG: nucleotidyltransferase domain-containing protein [Cyanobacteria bacterium J06621_11]